MRSIETRGTRSKRRRISHKPIPTNAIGSAYAPQPKARPKKDNQPVAKALRLLESRNNKVKKPTKPSTTPAASSLRSSVQGLAGSTVGW